MSVIEMLMERARAHSSPAPQPSSPPIPVPRTEALPVAVVPGLAVREVLAFDARWLVGLPVPAVLVVEAPGIAGLVRIDLRERPAPGSFDAHEWLAMVAGAESGRVGESDFATWATRKRGAARWRLTEELATSGRVYGCAPQGWPVARVLERFGAVLRAVALDGEGGES